MRCWPHIAVAVVLLLPALPLGGADRGDGWWLRTALDADRDGLDDGLAGAQGAVRVLVDYAAPPGPDELAGLAAAGASVVAEFRIVPTVAVDAPAAALPALAHALGVVLVERDVPLHPTLDRSRPLVRAPEAQREFGVTGAGLSIAVLDTGIDPTHPDLRASLLAGFDATLPHSVRLPLLGDPLAQPQAKPADTDGHGTHVAGIAAGPGGKSGGRFVGIAPAAGLVSVKVFDGAKNGSSSDAIHGIDWVVEHRDAYHVRVVQMSFGGSPTDGSDALSRAVDAVADQGMLGVVAAGNDGPQPGTVGTPGVAARALTVGAVDKSLVVASFSARGPTSDGRSKPDIVAPGVDITSTMPAALSGGADYATMSGTSMAAPHVSGAAVLVWQANASLAPDEVKAILVGTARPLGPSPGSWDGAYGWGFLDVEAAVRVAKDPSALGKPLPVQLPPSGLGGVVQQIQLAARGVQRQVPAAELPAMLAALGLVALAARRRVT